jgi:hypothetical protein
VRVVLRALALLQLAKGVSAPRISAQLRSRRRPFVRLAIGICKVA